MRASGAAVATRDGFVYSMVAVLDRHQHSSLFVLFCYCRAGSLPLHHSVFSPTHHRCSCWITNRTINRGGLSTTPHNRVALPSVFYCNFVHEPFPQCICVTLCRQVLTPAFRCKLTSGAATSCWVFLNCLHQRLEQGIPPPPPSCTCLRRQKRLK